jgi:hypothetical protein
MRSYMPSTAVDPVVGTNSLPCSEKDGLFVPYVAGRRTGEAIQRQLQETKGGSERELQGSPVASPTQASSAALVERTPTPVARRFVKQQIPDDILNNEALNTAITALPANYSFEVCLQKRNSLDLEFCLSQTYIREPSCLESWVILGSFGVFKLYFGFHVQQKAVAIVNVVSMAMI